MKNSRIRTIFLWVLIIHISLALIQKKTAPRNVKKINVTVHTPPPKVEKPVVSTKQRKQKSRALSKKKEKKSSSSKKKNTITDSLEKCLDFDFSSEFEAKADKLLTPNVEISLKITPSQRESSEIIPDEAEWKKELILFLKHQLCLPEYGEVAMKITIDSKGKVQNLEVLSSKSSKNSTYLKNTLQQLQLPCNNRRVDTTFEFLFRNENH